MYKNLFYALLVVVLINASSCVKIHECNCHIVDDTVPSRIEERDEINEIPGTKKFADTECKRRGERMRELYDEASDCKLK